MSVKVKRDTTSSLFNQCVYSSQSIRCFCIYLTQMHGTWNSLQQCVYGEASSDKIHITLQKHGPEETNPT